MRCSLHSSLCILLVPRFNLATMRFITIALSRKASNAIALEKHYLDLWAGLIYARNNDDLLLHASHVTC